MGALAWCAASPGDPANRRSALVPASMSRSMIVRRKWLGLTGASSEDFVMRHGDACGLPIVDSHDPQSVRASRACWDRHDRQRN